MRDPLLHMSAFSNHPPATRLYRTRRRGFTLIEVLVVVAIIAMLVAILLPSLAKARGQARSSVCGSNVKQIGTAMNLFATEHKSRVPRGISRHSASGVPPNPPNWIKMVVRMLGDKTNYGQNFNRVPVEKHEVFSCPERSKEYAGRFLDYVVNSTDPRGPINESDCASNPGGGVWYEVEGVSKIDRWSRPADAIYVTEAVEESWNVEDPSNSNGTLRGIRENIDALRQPAAPLGGTGYDWFDVPGAESFPTYKEYISGDTMPRASIRMHLDRGSNAVFVDGHVELLKPPMPSAGRQQIQFYYVKRFGVDSEWVVPGLYYPRNTSALSPGHKCSAGDIYWAP